MHELPAGMSRQRAHRAIGLAEDGGTAGVGTMEGLVGEFVGQIYDEYDRPAESPAAGAAPVLDGATEIKDVNAAYGLQLPAADYNTVGGLVFGTLGRLPKPGDRVTVGAASFEVVEMDGRQGVRVRFLTSGARGQ